MKIISLTDSLTALVEEVAQIVVDGFEGYSWPDLNSAREKVRESLSDDRISRVAIVYRFRGCETKIGHKIVETS